MIQNPLLLFMFVETLRQATKLGLGFPSSYAHQPDEWTLQENIAPNFTQPGLAKLNPEMINKPTSMEQPVELVATFQAEQLTKIKADQFNSEPLPSETKTGVKPEFNSLPGQ